MSRGRPAPSALSHEASAVARGSVINIVAMVLGAVLGFGLTVLVSRWLQPRDAGFLFELIALFTILSNALMLGADTGLTRWIARARAIGGLADVRKIVGIALVPVLILGAAAAAATWLAAPLLARTFLHGMAPDVAASDVRLIAVLVPLGALSTCLLAAARGFGRMWPYLAVEGIGKPAVRIGLVLAALIIGWGLRGAIIGWSLPVIVGLAVAWFIMARLMSAEVSAFRHKRPSPRAAEGSRHLIARRRAASRGGAGRRRPGNHRDSSSRTRVKLRRSLARQFWSFAAPRGFAGVFQITVLWLDILLVGALLSGYWAGVYAVVSRLAIVGTFALEGTRLAIAPQLSALLARRKRAGAADVYQSATRWLMLASWPLYIVFAIFPRVALGIFGHRYTVGWEALAVLSLAMLINLGTGNVTVVLLMGGKSSWNVVNTLAALIVNVGLNFILLPRIGIVGAAIAWAASIVVDNVAAVIEVWWLLGLAPFGRGYGLVVGAAAGCFGLTGIVARELLGQTLLALVIATAVGLTGYAAVAYIARARLQLTGLTAALRLRPALTPASQIGQRAA